MKRVRGALDVCLSLLFLYLGVWLYELGNYLALLLSGAQVTFVLSGVLPAGVVAVGGSSLPGVAKLLQVAVATGVLAPVYVVLRRSLSFTPLALLTLMAIYLTSFYWEFLSLVGTLPLALHEGLFTLLSLGALVLLSRADSNLRGLLW